MGYNITYDELRNMQGMMNSVINDWLFDYDVLKAKFGEIVKDESMLYMSTENSVNRSLKTWSKVT